MNENSWLYWSSVVDSFFVISISRFHEWKFMALLKHSQHNRFSWILRVFPWMKIHGSIEAMTLWTQAVFLHKVSMNENSWLYWSINCALASFSVDMIVSMNENSWLYWSVRKCITRKSNTIVSMNENSWLYWSVNDAVEKELAKKGVSMNENSWLYWSVLPVDRSPSCFEEFPWMKIHGSIEAGCYETVDECDNWFPWMKIHGSIEACDCNSNWNCKSRVSMNENSWLYWSTTKSVSFPFFQSCFHEWKFMALLKRTNHEACHDCFHAFPWMKIHGSIEA